MSENQKAFEAAFSVHLGHTARWSGFSEICNRLLALNGPVHILETGCLRTPGNWGGDGQSTAVLGWIANTSGGSLTSVDISQDSIDAARSVVPSSNLVLSDSIGYLRGVELPEKLDLLYLDSYDADGGFESPLHHLGELAAIYSRLKSGCLIAVDDCKITGGKDKYIRMFFGDIKVPMVEDGYISVWEKP